MATSPQDSMPTTAVVDASASFSEERARIRLEYERRATEVPSSRYALTSPSALFASQQKVRAVVGLLTMESVLPLADRRILDVGCGGGHFLLDCEQWGAKREGLAGIDLLADRIDFARTRLAGAELRCGDATALPWPDASFDLVAQNTVFTSILDERMRRSIASEMDRVLRPGGVVLWYDFFRNNPGNRHVRAVGLSEIRALFPLYAPTIRRITLAPPLARRTVPWTWIGSLLLEKLTVLNTHYLALLRKPTRQLR